MKTKNGDQLSRLCFGTMQFGGKADPTQSGEIYAACRVAGINFYDTAYVYTEGRSEEILGSLVAQESDDVFVATKAAYDAVPTASNLRDSLDVSRKRLGLDVIDLLYLHRWNDAVALEEIFETLASMQEAGEIRHIGVSNYAAWQVVKAQGVARSFGTRIDALQPMYNLVKRQAEVEILPACIDQGIAVCPYSPLGGGLLTGKYAAGGTVDDRLTHDKRYASRYGPDWMHKAAAALPALAEENGSDAATLAVAWAMRHKGVTAPIISGRTAQQVMPSLAAMNFEMSDALYKEVTALSQTPAPATDRLEEA